MEFKLASPADIQQIQTLMDELNQHRQGHFSDQTKEFHERVNPYEKLKESDLSNTIYIVYKEADRIIGYIQGSIHQRNNHKFNKLGYIEEIFVIPQQRGKGIAKKLLNQLESNLKNSGCNHLTVHTDTENEQAKKLYLSSGMSEVTTELWKKL